MSQRWEKKDCPEVSGWWSRRCNFRKYLEFGGAQNRIRHICISFCLTWYPWLFKWRWKVDVLTNSKCLLNVPLIPQEIWVCSEALAQMSNTLLIYSGQDPVFLGTWLSSFLPQLFIVLVLEWCPSPPPNSLTALSLITVLSPSHTVDMTWCQFSSLPLRGLASFAPSSSTLWAIT